MLRKLLKQVCITLLCCNLIVQLPAQRNNDAIAAIEKAYELKNYTLAEKIVRKAVADLQQSANADSLNKYIIWVGKVEAKKSDAGKAIQKVNQSVLFIESLSPPAQVTAQAWLNAGEFFGLLSKNEMGYKANERALAITMSVAEKNYTMLATAENNMATFAQRMGDVSLSIVHGRKALQWMMQLPKPNFEKYYLVYNSMGTGMYYISKLDSALHFFNKALDALSKAEPTPENKYYRPAIIQNNMAGIYGVQGKFTADIAAMKTTINYLKLFLQTKEPHPKKQNAVEFQFEATDNLAGIYKQLGDYKQAHELLYYSYLQKQRQLPAGDDAVFKSEILLGQLYFAMRQFDKCEKFLQSGLAKIAAADGDYLFWQADACNTLALLYEAKKENIVAGNYYEKADSLYEESLQGEYDNIYLEFLTNAATFYASIGQAQKAISKADKGYAYTVKAQGATSLPTSYQLLNLSQVYYLSGRYNVSLEFANKALTVMNSRIGASNNLLDSITTELKKPKAILARAKSQYQLLPQKNIANLSAMLKELEAALALLEKRKSLIGDAEDIGLLVAEHDELLQFVKKINFDLFQLTKKTGYIDQLVGLHESGVYNRIRSRLNQNDSLQFINVPPAAMVAEKRLKAAITTAFEGEGTHDGKMNSYLVALKQWDQYLENIRVKYPRYYKMRYGSIFESLTQVQKNIPAGSSVVRYFYIEKDLYAMVADANSKNVFALQSALIEKQITALSQRGLDVAQTSELLYELYKEIWAPLAGSIHNRKIIIIPDGVLYNLSFETLTPQKISTFKELATKSLLANFVISYHYSLFLLEPLNNGSALTNNFVAFAPGFSDEVKAKYRSSITTEAPSDNSYLSLLPQPFSIQLATKMQEDFGGNVYINDQSTTASFKRNAGGHKIIHIGTHAESNNQHPEYSRLIFVKSNSSDTASNSLFLPEIYNCDLTSALTVLTACESGHPGYKDGEGMISLAHAFNYAGSKSILTGLWKIDEQASMILADAFYKNLAKSLPKDEALRQAKLSYLEKSQGRTLAPEYWAGLVIMGDTSPLQLTLKKSLVPYWAAGIVLIFICVYFRKRISITFNGIK